MMHMRYSLKQLKKAAANRRFIAAVLAVLLVGGAYLLVSRISSKRFGAEYAAYAELAKAQENAAYLPAAPNNPVRQQLNLVLSETLEPKVSSEKRLSDAKLGLDLLTQLEAQVDTIGSAGEAANDALAKMQVDSANGFLMNGASRELINLAKQQAAVIQDIRGLSYRADFDTRKIFERVIIDKGALTAAHARDLNNELPEIETQFDRRTNLYTQLQDTSARIDALAESLGSAVSAPRLSE